MKTLKSLVVHLTAGGSVTYHSTDDDIGGSQISESNVLVILDKEENPIAIYSPMAWLFVEPSYETAK